MAEPVVSLGQENKFVINNVPEKGEESDEENTNLETNTSLISGLNLVLILSFLSLSAEECTNFDDTIQDVQTRDYDHKSKNGSCFPARRRVVSQFPAIGRQTSKVHTKIRDFRHCRRL